MHNTTPGMYIITIISGFLSGKSARSSARAFCSQDGLFGAGGITTTHVFIVKGREEGELSVGLERGVPASLPLTLYRVPVTPSHRQRRSGQGSRPASPSSA